MYKKAIKKVKRLKNERNYHDLIKLANNGMFEERYEALKALREIGNSSIIPDIIKCIDDKIQMVSLQAMDTIKAHNPDENTIQLINEKIAYWNEYDVKNNKKTRHFRNFSNVQLLYHYSLSTTYQDKKEALERVLNSRGGYDSVKNTVIQEFAEEIKKYKDLDLVKTYHKIEFADLAEYETVVEMEVDKRGGIGKLENKIMVKQEINRKKRQKFKKYIVLSLISLLVIAFFSILYSRNRKIIQAEEKLQRTIEQNKYMLDDGVMAEWVRTLQLESMQYHEPDFNYDIDFKFSSIQEWFTTFQQIQDTFYMRNSSYIKDYADVVNKDLIVIAKQIYDPIASENKNYASLVNTIYIFFANNHSDFFIEYTITLDSSAYEIKVLELTDCNFDNDSADYFYYTSKDTINELLFYDKNNIIKRSAFRDSIYEMLEDAYTKYWDDFLKNKNWNEK